MPHVPILPLPPRFHGITRLSLCTALALALTISGANASITAGGIAILGYTDHNDSLEDSFSIATLQVVTAGTTLYFTDNGWHTLDGFYGASNTNGNGNETLIKLTFNQDVGGGQILRAGYDTAAVTWDVSSDIGASNGDKFSLLGLSHASGEQIYAFEAGPGLPLMNVSNHVYVLDFGDFSNPGFEDADSTAKGNVPTGLSVVANTAVTLPDPSFGSDPNDFHNGTFALNMADADVIALNASGGTRAQWLALIADSTNWLKSNYEDNPDDDAEAQLSTLHVLGVPEPSRMVLAVFAWIPVLFRRRR